MFPSYIDDVRENSHVNLKQATCIYTTDITFIS